MKANLFVLGTTWMLGVCASVHAFAADALEHPEDILFQEGMPHDAGHHGAEAAHHGASAGGLPQLDPSSYPSQIFWLIVVFAFLYLVFGRKVLPDISNVLENRQEHIQGDLDVSDKLTAQAEEVHKTYEDILAEARKKASQLYVDIENDIAKKTQKEYAAFQGRLEKEIKLTEARLDKVKKDTKDEMDGVAAEIAALAAEKIIGVSADIDQVKSVIKDINSSKAKAA